MHGSIDAANVSCIERDYSRSGYVGLRCRAEVLGVSSTRTFYFPLLGIEGVGTYKCTPFRTGHNDRVADVASEADEEIVVRLLGVHR